MNATKIPPLSADDDNGLVFACLLDGKGGGKLIGWDGLKSWRPADGPLWAHFNGKAPGTADWFHGTAGLSEVSCKVLLEEETRPRVLSSDDALLAILRGINLNEGEDPYDMVALRMRVDDSRLITVRFRPMKTPREVLADFTKRKAGAKSVPALFVQLTERLTVRMNAVVVELDEKLDEIEEQLEEGNSSELRRDLSNVRYTAVGMRRYLGPQREALTRIQLERPPWLKSELESLLREAAEKLQRYIEDLDAARERAMVIRDEISNRLADAMNQRMYALAIITGIFLPLGLLTGLLGINVGGMPGVESGWAFWVTCALLVIVIALELYIFRRWKWI